VLVRTWNLFHGNASPPERRAFLREMVELATADRPHVVCLQEIPVWALSQLEPWSGMQAVTAVARRPLLRSAELGRWLTELHHGLFRSAVTGEADAIGVAPGVALDDARVRYAIAWNLEREQKLDEAAKQYIEAQASAPPRLAADAAFALGNVYFAAGVRASRSGLAIDGPRPELAEFELARDAYRSALRIDPQLYGARYNLELLERMAPARPTDGWRRNTDPVKIQADKHNGWTTIRETKKRGLP